jgi:undecaprenyl-diphosphatase
MDQKLFLLINRVWTHPALDRLFAALSSFDFWLPVLLLLALLAAWRGGFRTRAFLLTAALTAGATDGLICAPLKRLTNRPRPGDVAEDVRQVDLAKATPRLLALLKPVKVRRSTPPAYAVPGRSFPSSHSANTMAIAVLAALFHPRRGWVAIVAALGVAYSRIYTGSHWPSDVAASVFLGTGIGLAAGLAAELAWRRWGARVLPRLRAEHPQLLLVTAHA